MARKIDLEISQIVEKLQSLGKQAVAIYEQEVDQILCSTCWEKKRIEHTLDGMLGFCFDKDMLALYKKLCRYYYGIDQDVAARYVYAYREMWDAQSLPKQRKRRIKKH